MASAGLIDAYDIRELHRQFPDFPIAQLQTGPVIHEVAPLVGGGSNVPNTTQGIPQRWWFTSADGERVLQLQDDFVSFNWRRTVPPGTPVRYPGYDALTAEFKDILERLTQYCAAASRVMPSPAGCELLYDNIIPMMRSDGSQMPISSVLREINRTVPVPFALWQMSWLENIAGVAENDPSTLRIEIRNVGVVVAGQPPAPVIKMVFTCGAARTTWPDVLSFMDVAHSHIRERFVTLIEEEVQATWN